MAYQTKIDFSETQKQFGLFVEQFARDFACARRAVFQSHGGSAETNDQLKAIRTDIFRGLAERQLPYRTMRFTRS